MALCVVQRTSAVFSLCGECCKSTVLACDTRTCWGAWTTLEAPASWTRQTQTCSTPCCSLRQVVCFLLLQHASRRFASHQLLTALAGAGEQGIDWLASPESLELQLPAGNGLPASLLQWADPAQAQPQPQPTWQSSGDSSAQPAAVSQPPHPGSEEALAAKKEDARRRNRL